MKISLPLLAAITITLSFSTVIAAPIAVTNHSFETPDVGNGFQGVVPDGWAASNNASDVFVEFSNGTNFNFVNADGDQYVGIDNDNSVLLTQDLGISFQPFTTYTVEVGSADRFNTNGNGGDGGGNFNTAQSIWGLFSSDSIGTDLAPTGFARVETDIAGSPLSVNTLFDGADLEGQTDGGGQALGATYTFTTDAIVPTGNVVVYIGKAAGVGRVQLDNVRVDAVTVPAPATLSSMLIGLIAMSVSRRSND